MFGLFKKKEQESPTEYAYLDLEKFKNSLIEDGIKEEVVNTIVNKVESKLKDQIKEKTVLSYDGFFNTVSEAISDAYKIPETHFTLVQELRELLRGTPEIYNSVRLYSSYIVYGAAEVQLSEYKFVLSGEDTNKVNEAEKYLKDWERRVKIKKLMYITAKDVVSYCDGYWEKVYDTNKKTIQKLVYLPAYTIYTKTSRNGDPIKYYQIVEDKNDTYDIIFSKPTSLQRYIQQGKIIEFLPQEIVHFNDGSMPGIIDSPISYLIIQWRFFRLLEESLIIHRVTRARRSIIYFLDVTGKTKDKIKKMVAAFTNKLKAIMNLDITSGSINSRRSTIPASSDIVIPITKDSETRAQVIQSDPSASKTEDLKFYIHRLTSNLFTSHIFSTLKAGNEQYIEKAFLRMVRIYQKQIMYVLKDLYEEVLFTAGYKDISVDIVFPSPDPKEEVKIVDTVVRRMMIINQLIATIGIVPPTEWIIKYVFKDLTDSEVVQLVKMIEFAKKQEQEKAEGEELPSLLENIGEEEGVQEGASIDNPTDDILNHLFNRDDNKQNIHIKEQTRSNNNVDEYLRRSQEVINNILSYLKPERS